MRFGSNLYQPQLLVSHNPKATKIKRYVKTIMHIISILLGATLDVHWQCSEYACIFDISTDFLVWSFMKIDAYLNNGLFFFERLITATMCAYKMNNARSEKEQYIGYIYIFKTIPTTHFWFNALLFMWVAFNEQPV